MNETAESIDVIEEDINNITDEEAEAAFNEGAGEEPPKAAPEEKGITQKEEITPKSDETDTSMKEDETSPDKGKKEKPNYESLEKALNDTKTWGSGLAQENVQLKQRITELEKDKGKPSDDTKGKIETETKEEPVPDDVAEFYKDYPEAQKAILYEAQKLVKKQFGEFDPSTVNETITGLKSSLVQSEFEKAVITGIPGENGQWIDGHPDAYRIMASSEYGKWFEAELKLNPTLANISDPKEAIGLLTRFKTRKAKAAADTHDSVHDDKTKDLEDIAGATVETGTHQEEKGPKKDDEKTPEEIFEEHSK